jgi:hypothetical protein
MPMQKKMRSPAASRKRSTRTYRRSSGKKSVVPRNRFSTDIHYFKRWTSSVGFTNPIVGNAAYAPYLDVLAFGLNTLPNVSEFTTLFDHFMITKVVTKFYLKIDPSAQTAASASFPRLFYIRDTDDSTLASNLDELRQYGTCRVKVMTPNKPVTLVCKPNVLGLSYSTAVTNNYTPKWGQWIDLGDTATRHYGWKFAIDDLTNTNYRVNVENLYYFKCKNSR